MNDKIYPSMVIKSQAETIELLEKENEQLKKQKEELEKTNRVLSHEITKDRVVGQDMLLTVCGIPIGEIPDLQAKAELGEHYKHLYSELKKQKEELKKWVEEMQKEPNPIISLTFTRVLVKINELEGEDNENN